LRTPVQKAIVACCLIVGVGAAGVYWTSRLSRSEVDESVAAFRDSYLCPYCNHAFSLSTADATAQRRERGDIICPKCGKLGCGKETAMYGGELRVPPRDRPPDDAEEAEEPSPDTPPERAKVLGPAMSPRKSP